MGGRGEGGLLGVDTSVAPKHSTLRINQLEQAVTEMCAARGTVAAAA